MPRIKLQGSLRHVLRSAFALGWIGARVSFRRLLGRRLVDEWSRDFEIGNLFWRGQFDHAFSMPRIEDARAYFDSLQTYTDEIGKVERRPNGAGDPEGAWYVPAMRKCDATVLHFHGGGYSLHAAVTRGFADTLAHGLGVEIFAPDYRLTPEHPHPAQIEDALAAYRYVLARGIDPRKLVVSGDSAGGHLVLMALLAIRDAGLPQPALAIGISPWTDIGRRGASQFGNDRYDLVQGYMTLEFARRLKGAGAWTDAELSPISYDYRGLAPIYLQGGGKEILIDMIRDFAHAVRDQGAEVMLDVWEHMTHEFQSNGATLPESRQALERMLQVIRLRTEQGAAGDFPAISQTEVASRISACVPASPDR